MLKLFMVFGVVAVVSTTAMAQINLPVAVSQRGTTSQRIGVTDISIDYGRPSANERTLWGDLVPYDEIWRAGANENTVFTSTTPVKIEGKDLAAGRYGLHMIPGKKSWTIIFSSDSHAWGSYFYKQENDALRVTVTPSNSTHTELLTYDVPSVSASSATFQLRWGSLSIPFRVSVDLATTVVPDLKAQLTGLAGFSAQNYATAASWLVQNEVDLPLAKRWLEGSLKSAPSFASYRLAANLAEKDQQPSIASDYRKKAMEASTNAELNAFGYELMQKGKMADAIAAFEMNSVRFPKDPNVWDSLGEAYGTNNNKAKAIECFNKALSMNPSADVRKNSEKWLEKLR